MGTTDICEECGHEVRLHHADYGCEYERGDKLVYGHANHVEALVAMGPCGCTAVTIEPEVSK